MSVTFLIGKILKFDHQFIYLKMILIIEPCYFFVFKGTCSVIGQKVNFLQSKPELSSYVAESMLIVQPVPVEIYGALVSVLNDLKSQ